MDLDIVDRKILSELDMNCRISNTSLAKKVKKSREAVKYRIQKLVEKKIIKGFITSINPNRLGYYMFKVYLKLENIPEKKERFIEELKSKKEIYWYGISDGAYDLVFAMLSKNITEYYIKINSILSEWKDLIISKVLGTMVDTRQYNKRFFDVGVDSNFEIFGGEVVDNKIDELDSKILNILANNARIPLLELSRKVKANIETVKLHIKKLEKEKIILSYRIDVDLNKLNLEFFKAMIYFKKLSKKDEEEILNWMQIQKSSLHYIRSLAPWEAELEFAVKNYQEFNKIINDLTEKFSSIIRNHEHLILIKESWMPAYHEMLTSKK